MVSTSTVAWNNGYLGIVYGDASEVLTSISTSQTYSGVFHKDHIINFAYNDHNGSTPSFAVLYWRDST